MIVNTRREKGFALLVTTATMFLVIPAVGLAIDGSFLYAVRARLSAATDAAALAAARSLSRGLTLAEQEDSARARAFAFFNANFPDEYLMSTNKNVSVDIAESAFKTRTVDVGSSVDAALFFMRIFGRDHTTIRVNGMASRRDVNLMMVLDRSGSMDNSGSCEPMKAAAAQFVEHFANGRDRIGLVTFGMTYFNAFQPAFNFKPALSNVISGVDCSGGTGSAQALSIAYNHLQNINEPGALNAVVFFTDGLPNGLTADFPIKKLEDRRYGYGADGYNSTGSQYNGVDPSTCKDASGDTYNYAPSKHRTYSSAPWNPYWNPPATVTGVIAGEGNGTKTTGSTFGVTSREASSLTNHNENPVSMSNCRFTNSGWYHRRDIAYIPENDFYNNSVTGYQSLDRFPSGHPYEGRIRPDTPRNIGRASNNAADSAADKMRRDTSLKIVVYAIGLGDPSDPESLDQDFLRRVANDPTSPVYNDDAGTETTGLYAYAPDKTQLSLAFSRVASEILRITR